ncbi:MAG: GNAT family N-acetyltransferase [Desulfarculus sp.]|nr:MAG: GNAT family N-acetyltransferase [Desulfarculus sp.]
MTIRSARPTDHGQIIAVMPAWWGGRDLRYAVPRLFLDHFANTSFVMEHDGRMVGFIIGFLSPSRPEEGYAHFLGVNPGYRGQGIGRCLYERFFEACRENGRSIVRACTAPVNKASVAFHREMGFSLVPGDGESDGIPFIHDYNRPGDHKVEFVRRLG